MTSSVRTTPGTRRPRAAEYGALIDERHARRGLVDEQAVRRFAVLVQALAVIADHDDDGAVGEPARVEPFAARGPTCAST